MSQFTIRAYALVLNTNNEILLMDESYRGLSFTKFPGGGLEWGEGLLDCVKRELREELGLENINLEQFYFTDFFVESIFDTTTQVISVYFKTTTPIKREDVLLETDDNRITGVKWVPLKELTENDVTFRIDKKVVGMLVNS
jgi:ADP-ribose pyrophosphatase YjhB (NUDIX family)